MDRDRWSAIEEMLVEIFKKIREQPKPTSGLMRSQPSSTGRMGQTRKVLTSAMRS